MDKEKLTAVIVSAVAAYIRVEGEELAAEDKPSQSGAGKEKKA